MHRYLLLLVALGISVPSNAAELTWDFESGAPAKFFTKDNWGERDATFTYGPRAAYGTGSQWVGFPIADVAEYPGNTTATLTTKDINLQGLGLTALYVSWVHWGDIEGVTSNFDGAQFQISTDGGNNWVGIDDPPAGGLNPAYDDIIVSGGGTPLADHWAWCWDTVIAEGGLPGGRLGAPLPSFHIPGQDKPIQTAKAGAIGWRPVATEDLIALGYAGPTDTVQLRWLFASDQLAGGAGYFIDDLRIADSAPPCEIPPNVAVSVLVDTPDILTTHTVDATVTRVCADVDPATVMLYYTADGMADTASVVMTPTGGDDYAADIPAQSNDTDVWYWVSAEDVIGNRATTPYTTFEVTDAVVWAYDDGQPFYVDPSFFAADDGRAARFDAIDFPDSTVTLYKMLCFFGQPGIIDVGVWDDDGTNQAPNTRLYSSGSLTNEIDNAFWHYEFSGEDLTFQDGRFYVGFTFVTGDSLDNPLLLSDPGLAHSGVQYALTSGVWSAAQNSGDMMLRVKVKLDGPVGIEGDGAPAALPANFQVHGNFPNPFNPQTVIRYDLPATDGAVPVKIQVFDLSGRLVARLVDESQQPGSHAVRWDGRNDSGATVASGVYVYRVEAGDKVETRKMVVLK